MGRPEYDDAAASGDNNDNHHTTAGDTTGWFQHGQDLDNIQTR